MDNFIFILPWPFKWVAGDSLFVSPLPIFENFTSIIIIRGIFCGRF
jgi:hypothetical protein